MKRTISINKNTEVTFVALFSPGIHLNDMTINGDSVFTRVYTAGNLQFNDEKKIENIRHTLPEKLQNLPLIGYSNRLL